METLAPGLWIDNNVVDCWGAILNYEESVKKDPAPKRHFFPTGCIVSVLIFMHNMFTFIIKCIYFYTSCLIQTDAMVEGTIGKNEQWDVFLTEITAHFKNVNVPKFLAEIELVISHFIYIYNFWKS